MKQKNVQILPGGGGSLEPARKTERQKRGCGSARMCRRTDNRAPNRGKSRSYGFKMQ